MRSPAAPIFLLFLWLDSKKVFLFLTYSISGNQLGYGVLLSSQLECLTLTFHYCQARRSSFASLSAVLPQNKPFACFFCIRQETQWAARSQHDKAPSNLLTGSYRDTSQRFSHLNKDDERFCGYHHKLMHYIKQKAAKTFQVSTKQPISLILITALSYMAACLNLVLT